MKLFCRHKQTQLIEATPQTGWWTKVYGETIIREQKTIEKVRCCKCGKVFLTKGVKFHRVVA